MRRVTGPIPAQVVAAALLAVSAISAQTITGGYSGGSAISRGASQLPPAVGAGPTALHHPPTPSQNPNQPDGASQTNLGALLNANGVANFDGMNQGDGGYIPSDNNIAVGPNHVVEVVNAAYAVYS